MITQKNSQKNSSKMYYRSNNQRISCSSDTMITLEREYFSIYSIEYTTLYIYKETCLYRVNVANNGEEFIHSKLANR